MITFILSSGGMINIIFFIIYCYHLLDDNVIIWMVTFFPWKSHSLKEYSRSPAIVQIVLSCQLVVLSQVLFQMSCPSRHVLTTLFRLICQADLSRLTCLDCPVLDVLSLLFCRGCPATVVLPRLSCLSCPFLSCKGHPVVSFQPQPYFPDCPLKLSRPACPISGTLVISSPVPTVLSLL